MNLQSRVGKVGTRAVALIYSTSAGGEALDI